MGTKDRDRRMGYEDAVPIAELLLNPRGPGSDDFSLLEFMELRGNRMLGSEIARIPMPATVS
ncbi:hypothetical protein [Sinorhizobium mexicanum]|uniref:Uncharacterized protein n=1 Tax=Sinorhizobium mexicanum TaxID=375549 RepID=A0A859QNG0_9HYPH|nr:hypothetical protein [Sinorhizobium mexicanum]MBP1884220.1 hypothetical protein [Sinorhizobium mexicanum]QLL64925.1 hypothetical protein FKV68_26430 [Sinorhizobium mexicanum]